MRKVRVTRGNNQSAECFSAALKQVLNRRIEPWSKFDAREITETRSKFRKKGHCQRDFLA